MTRDDYKSINDSAAMSTYARFDAVIESGHGAVAVDVNGKEYIDFGAGIGVNVLGYCNEGWVNAVCNQAKKLSHTSNLYYNTATASLSQKLVSAAGMSRVFLCNSGAEANECAIKLCRKYSFDTYGAGRNEIITLCDSFHGRTMQTLTATGQDVLHPDCFAPYVGGYTYCKKDINSFTAAISERTCAVIMEPVQGEGGVMPLDAEFVRQVCEICRERDILIVTDEVQTGVGRTGKFFCFENFGIKPDIVTTAKGLGGGLPIGACLCGEKTAETFSPGSHGSTFGGNPIVCAGAEYVLEQVANESFLSEVARRGEYIQNELRGCKNVLSVRGMGMMIGIEVSGKTGAEVAKRCLEKGLLVLTAKSLVRLLPPLNISDDELSRGLEILKSVIGE